ncbi:hypothetical protein L1887_17085 [Cichorium endivia]|nr:hypothetical protein L1887_17085 [Cichorium endivia]
MMMMTSLVVLGQQRNCNFIQKFVNGRLLLHTDSQAPILCIARSSISDFMNSFHPISCNFHYKTQMRNGVQVQKLESWVSVLYIIISITIYPPNSR